MSQPRKVPTERLDIADPYDEVAVERAIVGKAAELIARGVLPTFQVWYPTTTEADFDVVVVHVDGTIETVPSFNEEESTDGE
jgi:hypothetical protein